MKARILTAATALVITAGWSLTASAAEPCAAKLSNNNPAFGEARPCPAPAPVKPGSTAGAKVTTENGRTVYTQGESSLAIGGYVQTQIGTGKVSTGR